MSNGDTTLQVWDKWEDEGPGNHLPDTCIGAARLPVTHLLALAATAEAKSHTWGMGGGPGCQPWWGCHF